MAVADSHCNTLSEFSDRKKRREEENPQTLASLERGSEQKKRRRKRKSEGSNEQPQVEVCSKPLLESVIPIVAQEENAETTAEDSNPTPKKKKKKKKNVQDAVQLLTCDPSNAIGVEPDVMKEEGSQQGDANGNGGLCPKPLLDTPIPIDPQEENAETNSQNPNPTPRRKKKKKNAQGAQQVQTCDPSILTGVELHVARDEGARQGSETAETTIQNPDPTPKKKKKNVQGAQQVQTCDPLILIGEEPDVARDKGAPQGSETAETTTQNPDPIPKKRKKKNVQGALQVQTCDPSILIGMEPDVARDKGAQQGSETAETTTQNRDPTPKKKKNVQGAHQQLQTCEPSISIGVEHNGTKEEGAQQVDANETAAPGINEECPVPDSTPLEDTPRKKNSVRKKKNALKPQGAESEPELKESHNTENPQQCTMTPKLKNKKKGAEANPENSGACSKQLDIAIPSDLELKKREKPSEAKVEHPPACSKPELVSQIDMPTPMKPEKKKEVEPSEAHAQHPQSEPCSKHESAVPGINEECLVPDPTPLWKKKSMGKKKNVLKSQGAEPEPESKESNNTEHPQQCSPDSELKIKMKKGAEANAEHSRVCLKPELAPPLGIAVPNDSKVKKTAKLTVAKVEDPQACSKPKVASPIDLPAPIKPEKKKEAEPIRNPEACAQPPQPQPCSAPSAEPTGDPTTPIDQSRRKRKNKRGNEKIMCSEDKVENQGSPLHMDITLNQATDQVQEDQATITCIQSAYLTDQTILVDPAIPIDPEQTVNKRKKQRKIVLEGEECSDNKHYAEQSEISIQTSTCLIEAPPMDPCLANPVCPAISTDPEQEMSKKKKKRKRMLKSEVAEPSEHNSKLPEAAPPEAPVQKSIHPLSALSIEPISSMGPSPPIDREIPIDQGQEMTKKKRKKKRRSVIIIEGTEPDEHVKPPETPVQRFVHHIVANSKDPTIPVPVPSIDTASPIDQGQKTSKKKRKRIALISEEAEPNEHDGKPPGTQVQRSVYSIAEPSIDPTVPTGQASPVDPATPVDLEQMTKKKRKKRISALKNEGLESEKHTVDLTAEIPIQKTEGTMTENSMVRCNDEPAAKTPDQRTDSFRATKSPFKQHGEISLRCQACRQPGHKFQQCPRLKRLSMDEEVCFFCGEIGHSLAKCGVSQAGGGRFAKCLLCYEHGHFSYNCPQNGHGIDTKVLAANGAINRAAVEAKGEPLAEV